MKIALLLCLTVVGSGLAGLICGGLYVYKDLNSNDYAEIILENASKQDIRTASIDYENYHIVVNNIPSGKQSSRIMYDTSKVSLSRSYVLDATFADGTTIHETSSGGVGTGEKVTIMINASDVSTVLRRATG